MDIVYTIESRLLIFYYKLMGYYGKIELKNKAQYLRKKGYSYNEILNQVDVSKDTLSRWCRNIALTPEQKNRLEKKRISGQKKGSIIAADNKRNKRIIMTQNLYQNAKKSIGQLSKRDRFILGIALYAGEGNKTDGQGGFSNTDPKLIHFMSKWFQEFCNLPLYKLRGALWLHQELSEIDSKKYWSKISGIPLNQFYKSYIPKNNTRTKKNVHKYGVFGIRFNNSMKQRQIMGWILATLGGKIPSDL